MADGPVIQRSSQMAIEGGMTLEGTLALVADAKVSVPVVLFSYLNPLLAAGPDVLARAAKAGVHGFTKALALEVAKKGVTVNTISPGYIGTKMVTAIPEDILNSRILPQIPVGRLGKPEEVAGLIIYLASDESAFVTGANIAINGGQHMQ